jgi:hypothetical protein
MDRDSGYNRRSCLGCLMLFGFVLLCAGVVSLTVDVLCHNALSNRLPFHPDAQIVTERHNLARRFGMGETFVELYVPAPSAEIREWYARTISAYEREARRSNAPGYRLSQATWQVFRAEDDTGSQVFLYGTCGN